MSMMMPRPPMWRSRGHLDPKYTPDPLERSRHRTLHALKYIAVLGIPENPLTKREEIIMEMAMHAAHADEAMAKNETERSQDHIDKMNALARQLRGADATTIPVALGDAVPAVEMPVLPERVKIVARDVQPDVPAPAFCIGCGAKYAHDDAGSTLTHCATCAPAASADEALTEPERKLSPEIVAELGKPGVP
jgi:hypothetical protein